MKERSIRLGPLALLLSVVALALSTLAILTFTTSRADLLLARRYADTVRIRYSLDKQGQEDAKKNSGNTSFEQEKEGYVINTRVAGGEIVEWSIRRIWEYDEQMHGLWGGE